MTTAGCAGPPALPVGSFVPSRSGRGWSAFLWLVFALVDSSGPRTGGIIRTSVTWRRIRASVVVPRILPILATLAELAREAAAEQVKTLVNALQVKRQAVADLALLLTVSTGTPLTPQPRSVTHQPDRSGAHPSSGPGMARCGGSGPQQDQNRFPRRKKVKPRSTSNRSAKMTP